MSKTFERHFSLFFFIIAAFIALASRWLPHPPNFTAVSGFMFVGGVLAARNKWYALAAFVPMILSDVLLGGYPGALFVYAGHLAVLLAGWYFAGGQKKGNVLSFMVLNLSSAFVFFVLSNLGVWWSSGMYARTSAGLAECFVMALPFFHQSAISQLIYGAFFVYGFYWLGARVSTRALVSEIVRR